MPLPFRALPRQAVPLPVGALFRCSFALLIHAKQTPLRVALAMPIIAPPGNAFPSLGPARKHSTLPMPVQVMLRVAIRRHCHQCDAMPLRFIAMPCRATAYHSPGQRCLCQSLPIVALPSLAVATICCELHFRGSAMRPDAIPLPHLASLSSAVAVRWKARYRSASAMLSDRCAGKLCRRCSKPCLALP